MAPVARNSLITVALFGAMVAALTSIAQDGNQPERSPGESFRAKQLLGSSVVLEGDKSVGTIDDIVLDADGNVD